MSSHGENLTALPPNIPGAPGRLSKCLKCHKVFYFEAEHKHHSVDDLEIIEAGTTCPHCSQWLHLGYLNQDLLDRQQELTNNRRKRAFKRDYGKWQVEAREALMENRELCIKCGQKDIGQTGEYKCQVCGLPTVWDDEPEVILNEPS